MCIRKLLLLILLVLPALAKAQSPVVRGAIKDNGNGLSMQGAAVTLIRASDSVLATFTRTAADGTFTLRPDSAGRYLFFITYPGFADFGDELTIAPGLTDIGTIPMNTRAAVLKDVVVSRKLAAIKIVGDTTEYAADSFKVRDGATVEDLLKKLPGLQVDKNGKITAQGEAVQKVLVDGEEFFSDDPAVVTQNLQSKTVDAVQVYDRKSDQAIFTGVDDGNTQKTINLKLKENMKKGFFGKIEAGGGTDGYFQNQGMINAFKGKRQLAAFGIVSNTAQIGLNNNDANKYGTGSNNWEYDENNDTYTRNGDDDELSGDWRGQYSGEGLPTAWNGGAHYANRWNDGKQHLTGNYGYIKQNVETVGSNFTQYILPDSQYFSDQHRATFTSAQKHSGNGRFEWKTDTLSTIVAEAGGTHVDNISNSSYNTRTLGGDGGLINTNTRELDNTSASNTINSRLEWQKKFKKKGRTVLASARENYRSSDGTGYLRSQNFFYTGSLPADTINQRKESNTNTLGLTGKLTYTEPLSKIIFLTLDYGLELNHSRATRLSFNRGNNAEGWSDTPDSLYSSDYDYRVTTNSGAASLRFVYKKVNFSFGGKVLHTGFDQTDRLYDTAFTRSYNNYAPQASFVWDRSRMEHLRFFYSGSTRQPTLDQIQPLRQNTDPLNIAIGNPNLKQSFQNAFRVSFDNYKALSGVYNYAHAGITTVQDAISQSQYTDALGRRTYQYINVAGEYRGYAYFGRGQKLQKADVQLNADGNLSINHSVNYINGLKNVSNTNSYGLRIGASKDWEKNKKTIAGLNLSINADYNDNHSTVSTLAASYWTSLIQLEGNTNLFWKLKLYSVVRVSLRERTATFDRNNNAVTWNAYVSRKFLKKDAAELRLSVFDILNQNIGFSRAAYNNVVTENAYNTIRRYGLLSVIWNFNHGPAAAGSGSGDDEDE